MKLFQEFSTSGYHSTLVTTFGIDFDAYEGIALPRLRSSGCFNNLVLADSRMLSHALDGASIAPRSAGLHYSVSGVLHPGVFHPKLVFQVGRTTGRIIVSSANMTAPGLAGNLEVAGVLSCDQGSKGEQRLMAAAWHYLLGLLDTTQEAIAYQVEWLSRRSSWLVDAEPAVSPVRLTDGSLAAFFGSGGQTSISTRFVRQIGAEAVTRLIVVSPYWDSDLQALRDLASELRPKAVAIVIDSEQGLFPTPSLSRIAKSSLFNARVLTRTRFIHAKILIAQTRSGDHVLYGSANCTAAGLGKKTSSGRNAEACLYRLLPPGTAVEALGLAKTLSSEAKIDPSSVKPFSPPVDLPLGALQSRHPGRFEMTGNRLLWWPADAFAADKEAVVELVTSDGLVISAALDPSVLQPGCKCYRVPAGAISANIARIRTGGQLSVPAVVVHLDAIREVVREARTRKGDWAVERLADATDEGIWPLDVMHVLEEIEAAAAASSATKLRSGNQRRAQSAEPEYRTLSYSEFIAGPRMTGGLNSMPRNDLAGSELAIVRSFLNRTVGLTSKVNLDQILDDESGVPFELDVTDEFDDAENANKHASSSKSDETRVKEQMRQRVADSLATREHISEVVTAFVDRIRDQPRDEDMSNIDILRLRAMLMIVAAAGRPVDHGQTTALSPLQVLPASGQSS